VPAGPLQLPAEARRHLEEALGERPWPPPARSPADELLAATAARILRDLADEPPAGLPDCAAWLLVVAQPHATALRAEALDARLLVAGERDWEALGDELREQVRAHAAVLRLELAGEHPAEWARLLPDAAPGPAAVAAALGADAPAVLARLGAPGFGELEILHAWSRGPDGLAHAPDVSGVLAVHPASEPPGRTGRMDKAPSSPSS
jgi:hypothetical protein